MRNYMPSDHRALRFKAGDPVFAFSDPRRAGAHVELAVVNQAAAARKPDSLDFAETASLPIAGCIPPRAASGHVPLFADHYGLSAIPSGAPMTSPYAGWSRTHYERCLDHYG